VQQVDEQPDDDVRAPGQSPLAWILVAAVAVPAVLSGDVARRVLSGELDVFYGASFGSSGQPTTMTQRWEWLQYVASPETGALASALGMVVVAALVLAQRPRALVPTRPVRWFAVAAGGVTVVVAGGTVLGTLVYAARDVPAPDGGTGFNDTPPDYLTLAPRVGPAVLALTLAVAATLVVLRAPAAHATAPADDEVPARHELPAAGAPDDEVRTDVVATGEVPAAVVPAAPPPWPLRGLEPPDAVAEPGTAPVGTAPAPDAWAAVPHLSEDELALYRRPRPEPVPASAPGSTGR